MTFQTPWLLAALALVPAGVALYVLSERRAQRRRAAFASDPLLANVLPRRASWRRHAPVALHGVAIGIYYGLGIGHRPNQIQTGFVVVWVLCTLGIVTVYMKRIRQIRDAAIGRRRPARP